jgi:hypothetical protein
MIESGLGQFQLSGNRCSGLAGYGKGLWSLGQGIESGGNGCSHIVAHSGLVQGGCFPGQARCLVFHEALAPFEERPGQEHFWAVFGNRSGMVDVACHVQAVLGDQ